MKIKKYISVFLFSAFTFLHNNYATAAYEVPSDTGLPSSSSGIKGILGNLLTWMLAIFGIIAIISFIVSGIQYFLAAGDEKSMQAAKRNATYSILGVVVALSAFVIIKSIDTALNATSSSF
jgi:hypothetical protein